MKEPPKKAGPVPKPTTLPPIFSTALLAPVPDDELPTLVALIRFLTPPLPHLLSKSVPYLVAFASALACSSNGAIDVKLLFRVDKGGVQRGLLSLWRKSLGDEIQMKFNFSLSKIRPGRRRQDAT